MAVELIAKIKQKNNGTFKLVDAADVDYKGKGLDEAILTGEFKGQKGDKGDPGEPFTIAKTYASVSEMNAGFASDGVKQGQFVVIDTGNVDDADNAKLYMKGAAAYTYLTDLSGAQGMQGPRGEKGAQGDVGPAGEKGETGPAGKDGAVGATPKITVAVDTLAVALPHLLSSPVLQKPRRSRSTSLAVTRVRPVRLVLQVLMVPLVRTVPRVLPVRMA